MKRISRASIYIDHDGYLVGLLYDIPISEAFSFFNTTEISITFILAAGASLECRGYLFTVHPDEAIHKYLPHIHVKKDGESVRYLLDSLERFKQDRVSRAYLRDEKKIIVPFLKENKDKLMGFWNMYQHGFEPPTIDQNGRQYCRES